MSKNSNSPIGKRIKEVRKSLSLSQEKLGLMIGIDEAVVSARMSQYENGVHTPDYAPVKKGC